MSETNEPALSTIPASEAAPKTTMDIGEIMAILPHRYPFLMIDRIIEIERTVGLVAIKNVSVNEPQFMGHFPGYPLMPGVLIVEAMAQGGAVLLLLEFAGQDDKLVVFTGIEECRFRRPVTPGDQVRIEVKVLNWRTRVAKMKGVCTVNGKVVADAIISAQVVPRVRTPKVEAAPEAAAE